MNVDGNWFCVDEELVASSMGFLGLLKSRLTKKNAVY
jgi:hypothetical protein